MNRNLLLLLLMMFGLTVSGQETFFQPTRIDQNLKGKVMRVVSVQKYTQGTDMNYEETWDYEQNGKLSEYVKRGFGGERKTVYPERKADNPRVHTEYDRDGDPLVTYHYDGEHRLVRSKHYIYGIGGTLVVAVEYAYDQENGGAVMVRKLCQYDKKEHLAEVFQYSVDEVLQMEEHYRYDKQGNLTERIQTFYDEEKRTQTREQRKYKYDKQGNWVHCEYFHNGIQLSTTDRTITYF